jgi:uncharacterized protein YodC (DUF2158 family)
MFNFKVGDVVYLKSGSPKLTVTESQSGETKVVWLKHGSEKDTLTLNSACFTSQNPN